MKDLFSLKPRNQYWLRVSKVSPISQPIHFLDLNRKAPTCRTNQSNFRNEPRIQAIAADGEEKCRSLPPPNKLCGGRGILIRQRISVSQHVKYKMCSSSRLKHPLLLHAIIKRRSPRFIQIKPR
jgi:hypothetical protein